MVSINCLLLIVFTHTFTNLTFTYSFNLISSESIVQNSHKSKTTDIIIYRKSKRKSRIIYLNTLHNRKFADNFLYSNLSFNNNTYTKRLLTSEFNQSIADAFQLKCSQNRDCFNCTIDSCSWGESKCNYQEPNQSTQNLLSNAAKIQNTCIDKSSTTLVNNYCGNTQYELSSKISLPLFKTSYATKNIFCKYVINVNNKNEVTLNFTKNVLFIYL